MAVLLTGASDKQRSAPVQTWAAGHASCTGLSIFLISALRSVGIPVRLAGTPAWVLTDGNHDWVEVSFSCYDSDLHSQALSQVHAPWSGSAAAMSSNFIWRFVAESRS